MLKKKCRAQTFERIRVWYIAVSLTYFSLFYFIPVRVFLGPQLTGAFYVILSAAGVLLLAIDLAFRKNWILLPHAWLLVLFFGAYAVSIAVNYRYGLLGNVKTLAWTGIQILFLCAPDDEVPHETHMKHLIGIADTFVFLWFTGALVSVVQFCIGYGGELANVTDEGLRYTRQGFVENRLFGIFADPNYASVCSLMAAGLAIMLFYRRREKRWIRIYYAVTVVFQMIYVILSGSRTALLGCMAAIAVLGAVAAAGRIKKAGVVRLTCSIMAAILSVVLFYAAQNVIKIGLSYVPTFISSQQSIPVDLERKDTDESENISNNRFRIWGDYLTVVASSPLVGVTPRGALPYAREHFPDLFIVERKYTVHNGYLDLLVGTGILGAVPLLTWLALAWGSVLRYLWKERFHRGEKHRTVFILAVILLMPMTGAFFLTELFFVKPVSTMLFWVLFGYLLCFVRRGDGAALPDGDGRSIRRLIPGIPARRSAPAACTAEDRHNPAAEDGAANDA